MNRHVIEILRDRQKRVRPDRTPVVIAIIAILPAEVQGD
jgi:hypothetical protein